LAERRTITVHVLGDERVHLAPAYRGRLKQGRLKTLCGKLAVTQLSPFAAAAAKAADRCRVCFGKVDENGMIKAQALEKAKTRKEKPRPEATIIDFAAAREAKPGGAAPAEPPKASVEAKPKAPAKSVAKKRPTAKRKRPLGRKK
jgi:hypothetical protein